MSEKYLVEQLLSHVQSEDSNIKSSVQDYQSDVNKAAHLSVLPYASSKGEKLIESMKNSSTCVLIEKFTKVKDKTVKEHQHDIVYGVKC